MVCLGKAESTIPKDFLQTLILGRVQRFFYGKGDSLFGIANPRLTELFVELMQEAKLED